jgi:arsenate reductase (thioredoxin)
VVPSINQLGNFKNAKDGIVTILSQLWKSGPLNEEYRWKKLATMPPRFRVLFLCTRNADRSIFAESFLRSLAEDRFEVYSGGETPAGEVHPLALKILRENFRLDTAGVLSKSWHDFSDVRFDFVITVSDDARERSPVFPGAPVTAHWSIEDPIAFEGSDEEKYQHFLQIAFQVKRRVELFACLPMEKLDHLQRETQTRGIHEEARHQPN